MPVRSFRIFAIVAAASVALLVGCAKKTQVAKTVPPPPPPSAPTATLAASPDTVERGQVVRLMWNTGNANEISITGVGTVTARGTTSLVPQSSTTYVLTAKGPGGSKEATARVTVTVPPPTISQAGANDEQLFSQNMKDVFFAYDKYSVPQNEQTAAEQDARFLAAHPNYKLLISGHCDERGSEEYNLGLGDNRANAVRQQLERLGISVDRIRTISYGKEKPFCTEETEACWQLNRRAHFSMQR
ncbi:MAG: peptidoglycan-associated lipoprotein Pal [Candidatus Korobacteraceae bacterium]|jgi:peptidoglycan-associated lipoprotein